MAKRMPQNIANDEEHLGALAMKYRGAKDPAERKKIADQYKQTVQKLIRSGAWTEMPAREDQLPDDDMPKEFFDLWMV
jgi:hypothetical protein